MAGVRQRALALGVVALVAAAGLVSNVWRPRHQASTRLPYSRVQFSAADATRAFAALGVPLVPKSRVPGVVTTIGTTDDAFEVDVFGDPVRVNATGSPDLITDVHGRYVRMPSACTPGIRDAGRWRANVRFVIRCANPAHDHLLAAGGRALAKL